MNNTKGQYVALSDNNLIYTSPNAIDWVLWVPGPWESHDWMVKIIRDNGDMRQELHYLYNRSLWDKIKDVFNHDLLEW